MNLKIVAAAVALFTSSSIFSAVVINVPEEIKIVAINQQDINHGLFDSQRNYQLNAGVQQISLRYSAFFQHHDNSHDILKSEIFTLTTPALKDGQYQLALINAPKDFDAAKQYKDQPIVGLYDQNKQLLVQKKGSKAKVNSWLNQFNLKTESDLSVQKDIKLIPSSSTVQKYAGLDQQLIHTWKQASKIERQDFMRWIAEQSN